MSYYQEDTSHYCYTDDGIPFNPAYYGNTPSDPVYYDDPTHPDMLYHDEAEPTHLHDATTWSPPLLPTPHRAVDERELEAYAEAAANRTYTWDEIHPAYRDLLLDDNGEDSTDPDPPPGHWIQARPIELLTTHIPFDESPEDYAESIYLPTDGDEYAYVMEGDEDIEVTDEYLEQVAQQIAAVRKQMAEWDAEDAAEDALEKQVTRSDPDDTPPVHPSDILNITVPSTAPPSDFINTPAVMDTISSAANNHQVFLARDRPAPVRHPPLRTPLQKLSYPNHSPPPRHCPSRPTSPRSPRSQYAVKHRARFRNNRSTQTDDIPHHGPSPSQAKDPPQPFDLNSLYHVPPHLLQLTLDDALKLVAHLSSCTGAGRRILKKAEKNMD
jgi:hypothetical protein